MPESLPPDSVGLVTPQTMDFSEQLELDCGAIINDYTLAFETHGKLNATRTNAIHIRHALYRFRRLHKQD